jgi:hypothetical protein
MLLRHDWTWDEFERECKEQEEAGTANLDDSVSGDGSKGEEQNTWAVDHVDFHRFHKENKNGLFFSMLLGLVEQSVLAPGEVCQWSHCETN